MWEKTKSAATIIGIVLLLALIMIGPQCNAIPVVGRQTDRSLWPDSTLRQVRETGHKFNGAGTVVFILILLFGGMFLALTSKNLLQALTGMTFIAVAGILMLTAVYNGSQ